VESDRHELPILLSASKLKLLLFRYIFLVIEFMPHSAYLLVAHGSRDPRPAEELTLLAQQVARGLAAAARLLPVGASRWSESPEVSTVPMVATAFLELQPRPLHEEIVAVVREAIAAGYDELCILPLFLLPGVHVMEDIPEEVAIAQAQIPANFSLKLCSHFGSYGKLSQRMRSALPSQEGTRILLSHGSRRLGGNAPVEALAEALGAIPAFWSVEPSLGEQVERQVSQNEQPSQEFTIIPYFLFSGGITDAIAQQQQELATRFPARHFHSLPPLNQSFPLAQWIVDWITTDAQSDSTRRHREA